MEQWLPLSGGVLDIPSHVRRIKLDVGLSICAPHSHLWLQKNPDDLLVFGFEPNPDACAQIKGEKPYSRLWPHRLPPALVGNKFHLVPCALGKERGEQTLYVTAGDEGCSSIFRPTTFAVREEVKVPVFPLSDFFSYLPQPWIVEYLKVDAQGSDLDILKGAGEDLQRVVYVTAEVEEGQYMGVTNSLREMDTYMFSQGFTRIPHPGTKDPTYLNTSLSHLAPDIYICQIG